MAKRANVQSMNRSFQLTSRDFGCVSDSVLQDGVARLRQGHAVQNLPPERTGTANDRCTLT